MASSQTESPVPTYYYTTEVSNASKIKSNRPNMTALMVGVLGVFLLGGALAVHGNPVQQYFTGPLVNPPKTMQRTHLGHPTTPLKFRMDPDDVIDVKAEVVDVTDDEAPNKKKPTQKPPPKVIYEETVYRETIYGPGVDPRRMGSQGNPYADLFNDPRMQGTLFENEQPPWWLSLLPYIPYVALGLLVALAVGCVVSGALGWIFTILGCLVFVNAILALFFGDDDDDRNNFRGYPPPPRGRPRDPWV